MPATISHLSARQILDSRGFPSVEAVLELSTGQSLIASVPSGASKGEHEAVELRDGGPDWGGQGVHRAISAIEHVIAPHLVGQDPTNQQRIDRIMLDVDGTKTKSKLGANALLAVSLATARAGAAVTQQHLYAYVASISGHAQPRRIATVPMMNVINGGLHAKNNLQFQEFMFEPHGFPTVTERIEAGVMLYHTLKKLLVEKGLSVGLGDEGGFAPTFGPGSAPEVQALSLLVEAMELAGLADHQVSLGLDAASSSISEHFEYDYRMLYDHFPLVTIEDPFSEQEWDKWPVITAETQGKVTIIGDDLLTTNPERIKQGIERQAISGVLIKPNQIGTLTETLEAIKLGQQAGLKIAVSHRSGETCDDFIADLAVAVGADWLKAGAPARGERVVKYNRLMVIEQELS